MNHWRCKSTVRCNLKCYVRLNKADINPIGRKLCYFWSFPSSLKDIDRDKRRTLLRKHVFKSKICIVLASWNRFKRCNHWYFIRGQENEQKGRLEKKKSREFCVTPICIKFKMEPRYLVGIHWDACLIAREQKRGPITDLLSGEKEVTSSFSLLTTNNICKPTYSKKDSRSYKLISQASVRLRTRDLKTVNQLNFRCYHFVVLFLRSIFDVLLQFFLTIMEKRNQTSLVFTAFFESLYLWTKWNGLSKAIKSTECLTICCYLTNILTLIDL